MRTFLVRRALLRSSILLVLAVSAPACTPPQSGQIGFNPRLSISEPPALGKAVELSLTFTSPNIKGPRGEDMYYLASIELAPTVYEVVKGSLQAKGRIVPGETHTLEVTVKSIRTSASAEITGRVAANRSPDDTRTTGDEDELFMTMTEDGATISRGMPSYSPAPTVIPIP